MKMPTVDDFLCCMKLETGGLVIGWFNAICDVIAFILGVICITLLSIYDCDDLSKSIEKSGHDGLTKDQSFLCSFGRTFVMIFAILTIIFAIGFFVIAYFCIRGTRRRDHFNVKPMMVLMGILTVLSFLEILSMTATSVGSGGIKCLYYGYQFVVLYSLYCKFKEEFERGPTTYYLPTTEKV